MRIVAGTFKSRIIKAPEGLNTRPSSDKTRQAIYNIIAPFLFESNVLDIFAGSGALGIEAISRGAKKATFIDNNQEAINCIKENIKTLNIIDKVNVLMDDYKCLASLKESFDIILLDPPYAMDVFQEIFEIIEKNHLLKEYGIIVFESNEQNSLKKDYEGFTLKVKKYGIAYVNILFKN